ncbi:TadE/TadG family type IV pilus assembly protein [Streptacidiphilus sp. N1-10]|uniref:TadE/TadG family type IV pilus assembly protein n=1 Tax=Streptacidiphilus jeojiensis TaxID=3229225 RepID=A0ABV6XMX6_9ACTN
MDADQERGSIAIEAAILVPAILLFLLLVIAAGRAETAKGVVAAAARDAARSASLTRTAGAAQAAAADSAATTLNQEGVSCQGGQQPQVDFVPSTQDQAGSVQVTVVCVVPLGDLAVPGMPGSVTMSSTFTSVLDLYRAS